MFIQVGCFDPYSDDPRLGVQKIALCKYTAKMVVAGTAGQVTIVVHLLGVTPKSSFSLQKPVASSSPSCVPSEAFSSQMAEEDFEIIQDRNH